ncbi:hypothetical protein ACTQ54_01560 [Fundicoccus sp. Sow4_H7]|uniref:hypothetical protein n=1 Tax=Fundicoccus sp. Sow4_H7 TaxID=3438784 RepID=UPI003F933F1B
MQKYKTKWENFKLLWQIVHQFKPTIILWMLVKITLSTVVPFAQLLLMSQVIQWLGLGLSIDNYLRELLLWLAGIIVLSTLEKFIENRFDYFSETFRMQLIPNITT